MQIKRLQESLKSWAKAGMMGQIMHKIQMMQERDHLLTKYIRQAKQGIVEAERIHKLQLERETERITELTRTKADFQKGIVMASQYLNRVQKKQIPDPIEKIIPKPPVKKIIIPEVVEDDGAVEGFKCPHCEKFYVSERHFKNHLQMKHGVN